jgi:hypothetical protein
MDRGKAVRACCCSGARLRTAQKRSAGEKREVQEKTGDREGSMN